MNWTIIAQIIAVIAFVTELLGNTKNKKTTILIYHTLANLLFAISYFILNNAALTAAYLLALAALRNIVFYQYEKKKKTTPIIWLIIYSLIAIYLTIISYENIYSLIPIITSLLYSYSIWQENLNIFRFITIVIGISWMGYDIIVGAFATALSDAIKAIIAFLTIIKYNKKNTSK